MQALAAAVIIYVGALSAIAHRHPAESPLMDCVCERTQGPNSNGIGGLWLWTPMDATGSDGDCLPDECVVPTDECWWMGDIQWFNPAGGGAASLGYTDEDGNWVGIRVPANA
jgi:hypothetical protein